VILALPGQEFSLIEPAHLSVFVLIESGVVFPSTTHQRRCMRFVAKELTTMAKAFLAVHRRPILEHAQLAALDRDVGKLTSGSSSVIVSKSLTRGFEA
jgi:hypothetical protein